MPLGIIPLARGWFCNWKFWSEPQQHLHNRRLYQPRGKVLGGSSAINATVYTRGHRWDYDHWAELGCEGWSYSEVLPYFIKSENFEPESLPEDAAFHGKGGPLNIAARRSTNPISCAFVEAAQQAGHRLNLDLNGAEQEGVGLFHVSRRMASDAAMHPLTCAARNRDPIWPSSRTLTRRGCCSKAGARSACACSVKGDTKTFARREKGWCRPARSSRRNYWCSRASDRARLTKHGIEVMHELPGVGQNLQDHLDVSVDTRAKSRVGYSFHPRARPRLLKGLFQYLFGRRGELTSTAAEAGGLYNLETRRTDPRHAMALPADSQRQARP